MTSPTKVPQSMLSEDYPTAAEVLALANIVCPIGTVVDYAGTAVPDVVQGVTWVFPYGQAVSRTTYATLFARLGTAYGVGNGTTTFNLPDYRGRVGAGQDDMGGVSADRITAGIAGFDGDVLGASGGDQRLHQHNHSVTDPGHTHSITPPSSSTEGGSGSTATGTGGVETVTTYSSASATTGISLADSGTGSSQNVQPTIIVNKLLRVL
jgi:microcystin-dependent protein